MKDDQNLEQKLEGIVEQIKVDVSEKEKDLFEKAKKLYFEGNYGESIECYDKAIEINPEYSSAWNNKGNALDEQGKLERAIECYDKAIEINPEFDIAKNNRRIVLGELNEK